MIAVSKGMGVFFDGETTDLLYDYINVVEGLYEVLAEKYEAHRVKKTILSMTMDVLSGNLKEV
mgnify:CR=1 FL=1